MPGKGGAERRRDPTDAGSTKTYTQAQFVQFYGPQRGPKMWAQAGGGKGGSRKGGKGGPPPLRSTGGGGARRKYAVGDKVRATGRLTGDRGQVVNRGAVGRVTAIPGGTTRLERGAVAEVKISGVTFDASPDMIESADRPAAPRVSRAPPRPAPRMQRQTRAPPRPRATGRRQAPPPRRAAQAERRPDPTMKRGQKGANKTYTKQQFVQFYGPQAKQMWLKAGKLAAKTGGKGGAERRRDPTMKAGQKGANKTYTLAEFKKFYGPDAMKVWKKAGGGKSGGGEEKRRDPTMKKGQKGYGKTYTKQQFVAFYGKADAAKVWKKAGGSTKGGKKKGGAEERADPSTKSKKTFTQAQFVEFYGKKAGKKMWDIAGKAAKKGKKGKKGDKKGKKEPKKKTEKFVFVDVTLTITRAKDQSIGWSRSTDKQLIKGVDADSPAAKAGVEEKMKIKSIAGKEVKTDDSVKAALAEAGETFEVVMSKREKAPPPAPKEKKDKKPRPPPSKPVIIRPRSAAKTALCRDLKCHEEGAELVFEFKADGSILAAEESLQVDGGKVAFGKIGADGPTDAQKWTVASGRLKCGDKVLALGAENAVEMQDEKEKDKTQAWIFRTFSVASPKKGGDKKDGKKGKKGEKRADPTETSGKKYSEQEFIKFYGKKNGAMLWKKAGKKGKKGGKKGKKAKA